jgi:sigma-E factor negative regulatory protein RseA
MNDMIKMQISAFIDDELPGNESELLLRRLSQDAELRRVVARYLEIGRNIRNESELPNMVLLRQRVAEELGVEPHIDETASMPVSNRFVKPIAGFAVAATVAILAIVGLQQSEAPTADAVIDTVADNAGYTQPAADDRLDEMFRLHENASGTSGSNAILSEFVALEINEAELVKVEPDSALDIQPESDSEVDEDEVDAESDPVK